MQSLIFSSTATIVAPQNLREISIRRYPDTKKAIFTHPSLLSGHFAGRMKASCAQKLMKSASVRRSGSFNGVEDTGLEGDKSGLKKVDLGLEGFEYTLNRISKWLLAAIFSIVILWKHDAQVMWAAMGSVLNSWLSTSLKQMLNQERPSALRSDPGMPSSHAQSMFFAVIFAVLSLIDRMKINGVSIAIGTFIFICGSYLSWLRVSQQLHTITQVLVGAAIGSTCGLIWFWMWQELVLETFISSIWIQKIVVLAAVGFCVAYFLQSLPHFLQDK